VVRWFNANRLHSSLRHSTPIEHEDAYYHQNDPRQQRLPGKIAVY
jgi:hypothetical protein